MEQVSIIENINAVEVFKTGGTDSIINRIKEQALSFIPDTSTNKGRKEIASIAARVASSKVALDKAGKELVAGIKEQSKAIDAERKKMRDSLDGLKEEVRKPLTDWENAEKAKLEAEAEKLRLEEEAKQKAILEEQERQRKELEKREAELKAKEEEIKAKQREQEEKERKELEERQRIEREKEIAKQAELKAKKEAEQAIKQAEEDKLRAKLEAEQQAKKAEQDRIEALQRAEREKQEAIESERNRIEQEKLKLEEEELKRSKNREIKRKVNQSILSIFIEEGCPEGVAKAIIKRIAKNENQNIKVIY